MDRSEQTGTRDGIPTGLTAECKEIARDIRDRKESVRYDKINAARVRMSSGYYNSEHVLQAIASRLLNEGRSE